MLLDSESFANLYKNAYPRLVVIAAALVHCRTEACDIVQQSAVVAIEKIEQFSPSSSDAREVEFGRWMISIVRNLAANSRRKSSIRRTAVLNEGEVLSLAGRGFETEEAVHFESETRQLVGIRDAFDDRLQSALESLSETSRICLLLSVVLHFTQDEIGRHLELPPGTVGSHISRAKKSLRDLLHDYRGPA